MLFAEINALSFHQQEQRRPNLPLELEVGEDDSSATKMEAETKRRSQLISELIDLLLLNCSAS